MILSSRSIYFCARQGEMSEHGLLLLPSLQCQEKIQGIRVSEITWLGWVGQCVCVCVDALTYVR